MVRRGQMKNSTTPDHPHSFPPSLPAHSPPNLTLHRLSFSFSLSFFLFFSVSLSSDESTHLRVSRTTTNHKRRKTKHAMWTLLGTYFAKKAPSSPLRTRILRYGGNHLYDCLPSFLPSSLPTPFHPFFLPSFLLSFPSSFS